LFTKSTGASAEKEVLLSPLGFSSTLKYFLGRGFNFPQDVSTSEGQVKLADLANSGFKNKDGPIVIFFEVIYLDDLKSKNIGCYNKWKGSFRNARRISI